MNHREEEDIVTQEPEENPYLGELYETFEQQLEELKQLQSFDKASLKKLRVLIQILLYEGRRCPVVVEKAKFQDWAQYYQ